MCVIKEVIDFTRKFVHFIRKAIGFIKKFIDFTRKPVGLTKQPDDFSRNFTIKEIFRFSKESIDFARNLWLSE